MRPRAIHAVNHAGPVVRRGSMTQPSASIRARTIPHAAPRDGAVSIRTRELGTFFVAVAEATLHKPYAQRACDAACRAARLRHLQDRPFWDHAARDIPPERDHQFARHRDNPNPPTAFALAKVPPIPLAQGAVRLPAHPIPRELNADRLQARVARATDS